MQFSVSNIPSKAIEYLYPSVLIGGAAALGLELSTNSFNKKTSHRPILTSIIAAVAVQILAIHVGKRAAIGAGLGTVYGVIFLKDVIKRPYAKQDIYAILAGIFLFGGAIGYGVDRTT